MAQPSSAADSDSMGSYKMVFVDTNLNTHLGLSFSVSDTVSDLKKKILVEHPICFPKLGEIEIHALKLKRKGKFYHLPDSVYIKDAINGVKSNGYLYLDASTLLEHSEKLHIDPSFDQACGRRMNNSSPDRVHLVPDGASRWLTYSNRLSPPQIGNIPCANEEVRITERLCSGESSRESSKDPMTEVKYISDNHCELASPVANAQVVVETRGKCDLSREDLEGPDKQIECKEGNSRDGISDVQCKLLLEGTMQKESTAKENKRNKHKKKKEDAFCDVVVKESEVLAGGAPKDTMQHDVVVADGTRMENGSVVQEHCRSSSSDANKQLDSGVQKTNDLSKGMGASVQQADSNIDKLENGVAIVKCNNLLGVNSEYSSPAKKKRKRLGSGVHKTNDVYEGIEVPVHNSQATKRKAEKNNNNKDAYGDMMAPDYSLGEKIESKNAASQSLSLDCGEDICSLQTSASTGKKKRKSSDPHVALAADLSPVKESREDSAQEILENNKDSGETEAVICGKSAPGETITNVNSVSLKKKHDDPVKEVEERNIPCSLDVGTKDPNSCDVGAETNVSDVEKMDTSKSCQVGLKDRPSSTVQELNDLESNIEVLEQGNAIVEYHKRTGVDKTDEIEEALQLYLNDNTEDKAPEHAKSSKKAKKSTRTKNAGSGAQIMSSTDNAEGSIIDFGESEKRAVEEVHLLQKINKSQAGGENVDGARKRKKRQTDVSRSAVEVQEKDQDTGVEIPVVPSDTERNDVSKINANDIFLISAGGETEKRTEEVPSLQEISKSQAGSENVNGTRKQKTKKRQIDVAKSPVEVQERDQDTGFEIPVVPSDTEMNDTSKIKTDEISLIVAGGETEKRTEEEVPSLQEISKSQAGGENVDGTRKRKTKRQTDVAISVVEVLEKDQDTGLEIPVVSSDTKRNDISKIKTDDIFSMATDGETKKRTEEEVPLEQEISKSQAGGENMDRMRKKKTNKRQTDAAKTALKVQEKDQEAGLEIPVVSSNTKRKRVSKIKTDGIPLIGGGGGATEKKTEEVPSLQEISKSQAGGENVDGKKRKKSKKMQTDIARSLPEVQEKDQDVGLKNSILSCDTEVLDVSSERTKKTKLSKSSSLDPKVAHGKDGGVAADTVDTELVSGTVDCSQVPSHVTQDNDAGQALEPVGIADSCDSGDVDEGNNQKEVSNVVNSKDYFMHGQDVREVKSAGKVVGSVVIRDQKSDKELKSKKNTEKLAVHPISESPNLQSSVKVNLRRGSKSESHDGNSSTIELPGSLMNKSSEPLLQSNKNALKVSGSRMTPALKLNPVSKEPGKPNILIASGFSTPEGKNKEVFAKPSSSLKSSKESTQRTKGSNKDQSHSDLHPRSVRKSSGSNLGEVVNKTERNNKSLLATSSAIFKDDSSKSSSLGDQAGIDSDASTRTPSNNLSSSDEESDASPNGSDSSEEEEDGRKNLSQTFSSVPKSVKLDAILRSSSRYKKVKLSASQSQPKDSESQPIDFVPDSEANS